MSENTMTQKDESEDTLDSLGMSELRMYAKLMGISARRDWDKNDFITAIKLKQSAAALYSAAEDEKDQDDLPPGHAKILIMRDPTPGHNNSSIPLGLNGRMFIAPRGVEFVIPLEYIGVLADAKSSILRQVEAPSLHKPEGVVKEEEIYSYPFQVLRVRPHTKDSAFKSQLDQRGAHYARKKKFYDAIGKWPTVGELMEFERNERELQTVERHLAIKQ